MQKKKKKSSSPKNLHTQTNLPKSKARISRTPPSAAFHVASALIGTRLSWHEIEISLRSHMAFCQRYWVPYPVIAIPISHVPPPKAFHCQSLLWRQYRRTSARQCMIAWACVKDKVSELGRVRGIFVIHLVAASRGCPRGTIPNSGVEGHGFRGEVGPTGWWHPFDFPYGDIINIESARKDREKCERSLIYFELSL